jgi:hypothetical protein
MNADLEKLLGAFATDTLTEEERKRLFTAALADQQLFNALADEQALKELLADPEVRRRLLQSLRQPKPETSGVTASWFNWAARPATLAVAGGLSAAVLAVVLGIRISQDSLRTTVRPPVTEEAQSAPAQTPLAAQSKPAESSDAPATPPEARRPLQRPAQSSVEHTRAERQKKEAVPSSSRENGPEEPPAPAQAPVVPAPVPGAIRSAPQAGARALFYAGEQRRSEAERAGKSDQAGSKAAAPSRDLFRSSQDAMGQGEHRTLESAVPSGLLGLRYRLTVRKEEGPRRRADETVNVEDVNRVSLTVQSNQDAYLQIWMLSDAQSPKLIVPEAENGTPSASLLAGEPLVIPLPMEQAPFRIAIRIARRPFDPLSPEHAPRFGAAGPLQSQESLDGGPGQEPDTYVVTQDLSLAARIEVTVPIAR